mmetsp:Transcript_66101/g.193875  ORF Transcript_66101/g.193875 Transcript_66101/m.193875 type:complete len:292 (+) Transcript_66101:2096-2971(+)
MPGDRDHTEARDLAREQEEPGVARRVPRDAVGPHRLEEPEVLGVRDVEGRVDDVQREDVGDARLDDVALGEGQPERVPVRALAAAVRQLYPGEAQAALDDHEALGGDDLEAAEGDQADVLGRREVEAQPVDDAELLVGRREGGQHPARDREAEDAPADRDRLRHALLPDLHAPGRRRAAVHRIPHAQPHAVHGLLEKRRVLQRADPARGIGLAVSRRPGHAGQGVVVRPGVLRRRAGDDVEGGGREDDDDAGSGAGVKGDDRVARLELDRHPLLDVNGGQLPAHDLARGAS